MHHGAIKGKMQAIANAIVRCSTNNTNTFPPPVHYPQSLVILTILSPID